VISLKNFFELIDFFFFFLFPFFKKKYIKEKNRKNKMKENKIIEERENKFQIYILNRKSFLD